MSKNATIKKIIFLLLFTALFVPFIQQKLMFAKLNPLMGSFELTTEPAFSWDKWFKGEYQNLYDKFYEGNIGLRNFFVRLYNQADYSFFKVAHGGNIIVGKNGCLHSQNYIDAYLGRNFVGENVLNDKLKIVRSAQDYLKRNNIDLITVLSPGKATFYKESFDNYTKGLQKKISNYDYLAGHCKDYGVNLIDLSKLFVSMKDTSRYPLFAKQGIHWSYYGAAVAADTIIRYVERIRNVDCINYRMSLEISDQARNTDYDLGDLMNILYRLPDEKLAYPKFEFEQNTAKQKPRVLVIGDSFYWTIYNQQIFKNVFDDETFWYYNTTIYPEEKRNGKTVADLDLLKEVKNYDVVIFLMAEPECQNPGFGFADNLGAKIHTAEKYVNEFIFKIKNEKNEPFFMSLLKNAEEKSRMEHQDLDKSIYEIAEKKAEEMEKGVNETMASIRNNPGWLKIVEQKAKEQNRDIDEVIKSDAEWTALEEMKKGKTLLN